MAIDINIPSQVKTYANLAGFPATGSLKTIFIAEDTNKTYRWTGSAYVEISSSQAAAWGAITGTLSAQTDLQNALNAKVTGNTAITGATKTKITYDSKGLVTSGTDATTADIADSINKRYVTDANLTVIGNTSGVNTGDQTLSGLGGVPTSRTLTINGTTQDLSADRTFTISTGITIGTTAITSGTVGRVLFEGTGNVVSESANLFWDNTNGRLGVGGTPSNILDVQVTSGFPKTLISFRRPTVGDWGLSLGNEAISNLYIGAVDVPATITSRYFWRASYNTAGVAANTFRPVDAALNTVPVVEIQGVTSPLANYLSITSSGSTMGNLFSVKSTGNVLINTTTDAGFKLDVNGTARVSGLLTLGPSGSGNFLQTQNNTASWYSDINNPLRITLVQQLINLNNFGDFTIFRAMSSARGVVSTSPEAFNTAMEAFSTTNGLVGRNLVNVNKSIFYASTKDGGSVQNAPLLRYFHAVKGNLTGYTNYRGIEIEDLDSYFGTTSGSVGIGANTSINASAILDITSTTKGFLPPRMTTTQKNAIATPATGLMVYDTTLNLISVYNGTTWITL